MTINIAYSISTTPGRAQCIANNQATSADVGSKRIPVNYSPNAGTILFLLLYFRLSPPLRSCLYFYTVPTEWRYLMRHSVRPSVCTPRNVTRSTRLDVEESILHTCACWQSEFARQFSSILSTSLPSSAKIRTEWTWKFIRDYLSDGNIGQTLLLRTNRKAHMGFRLVYTIHIGAL